MNKQIFGIIFGIFLLSFASAMYNGECNTIEFPNYDGVSITITGNSSDMEGFDWEKKGKIITYCFDYNYKPDNMTIKWWNYQTATVTTSSGGGSGCSYDPNYDWNCSEWSECNGGTKTRTCNNNNNCGNTFGKPREANSCLLDDLYNDGKGVVLPNDGISEDDNNTKTIIIILSSLVLIVVAIIAYMKYSAGIITIKS